MEDKRYTYIIYFIVTVITLTLAIQLYWNYKNYEAGKVQLVRDVQIGLDLAVGQYYEELAAQNTIGIFSNYEKGTGDYLETDGFKDFLRKKTDSSVISIEHIQIENNLDSLGFLTIEGAHPEKIDSIIQSQQQQALTKHFEKNNANTSTLVINGGSNKDTLKNNSNRLQRFFAKQRLKTDSIAKYDTLASGELRLRDRKNALETLSSKIVISFNDDTIDIKKLDTLVKEQLLTLGIDRAAHSLTYSPKGDTISRPIPGVSTQLSPTYDFNVVANSKLLPAESILSLGFNDITTIILKRNLAGILLSFILIAAVIASLLYLLKIIREQKQLAEIKNDFISNITHEFKTPIATISAAIEGIQHFNKENDKEKTEKYLAMSTTQLGKLNTMVERILDTATLDKNDLSLQKEHYNLVEMLEHLIKKYKEIAPEIPITVKSTTSSIWATVDIFHLENAIDNLVDNATKYGKPPIVIAITNSNNTIHLSITDAGTSLSKDQAAQLFEKFYRVPKGNTHDVKGFGIGLYYTKTIIEKHGGAIEVLTTPQTSFKITIPDGND